MAFYRNNVWVTNIISSSWGDKTKLKLVIRQTNGKLFKITSENQNLSDFFGSGHLKFSIIFDKSIFCHLEKTDNFVYLCSDIYIRIFSDGTITVDVDEKRVMSFPFI